jgi:hypothetical protein
MLALTSTYPLDTLPLLFPSFFLEGSLQVNLGLGRAFNDAVLIEPLVANGNLPHITPPVIYR